MANMTPSRRTRTATRSRALLCTFVVLGLVALGACTRGKPPETSLPTNDEYVALGDSYTAVSGDGPVTDESCLRSERDYPALVAKALEITSFTNASCAGAKSADLTGTQVQQNNRGSNPPQLDPVTPKTKLVTLGIGLNDNGVSYYMLYLCMPVDGEITKACQTYLDQPVTWLPKVVRTMSRQVKADIESVREKAPDATVVLVGYPRLLPDVGECTDQVPVPKAAADRIRAVLLLINESLEKAAKRADAEYVDMYTPSEGHDVCSDDPWVNGQKDIKGKALAFHSYDSYHRAVADRIVALLKAK